MNEQYVIGVDYGTDSVRSIIVDASNGNEIASSVFYYPRWKDGLYCDASRNQFRQHPLDYIEGLEHTIKSCLQQAGSAIASGIKAISVDTTGSTPIAVDQTGTPLALLPEFAENPNAMFVLWKDHTATKEAAEIAEPGVGGKTQAGMSKSYAPMSGLDVLRGLFRMSVLTPAPIPLLSKLAAVG